MDCKSGGESRFLRKVLHSHRLEVVVTWSKVVKMEMGRVGWIWAVFCRCINVFDMKDQKGGIRNNDKMFGLSNQMVRPFFMDKKKIFGTGIKHTWKSKILFKFEMPGNQLTIGICISGMILA